MKNLGLSVIAMSLFIRDRASQSVSDFLVVHLGIGPFGVATGILRTAGVLQAATLTTKAISGHLHLSSVFEVAMAGVFCWVCFIWSKVTAAASRRPPRSGMATASALRRDDYLTLMVLIVGFLAWDLVGLVGASFNQMLATASDVMQGLGFLLGSTLWRDLPRSRGRNYMIAPSAT